MFDNKYYQEKKQKLVKKAQELQNEYLQGAFKFVTEMTEMQLELNKIMEYEKENAQKEAKKDAPKEEASK